MERLMVSFFIVFATCTFSCFSSDEEKQVGAEGESCFDNGTCNPSLTCVSDRCIRRSDAGTDLSLTDTGNEKDNSIASDSASNCGNSKIDSGEECDGKELGKKTCIDQGFTGGELKCTKCKFDTTECYKLLDGSGIPITTSKGDQYTPSAVSDGTNYIVTWSDRRSGTSSSSTDTADIYGARVDKNGKLLDTSGFVVSNAQKDQVHPDMAVGSSQILTVWADYRSTSLRDIYGARVLYDSTLLDTTGIKITTSSDLFGPPSAFHANSNYLVAWSRLSTQNTIEASRIDAKGSVLDTTPLVLSKTSGNSIIVPLSISSDGTNFFIAWTDSRNTTANGKDIYGARISQSGGILDTNGIAISTASGTQIAASVTYDGNNYFVVWQDARNSSETDIYGARVSKSGKLLDSTGIPICTTSGMQVKPVVAFVGKMYVVVWADARNSQTSGYDLYGSRVSQNGVVLDNNAIPIAKNTGEQQNPSISSNGNTAFIVWDDNRNSSVSERDIYGSRIQL